MIILLIFYKVMAYCVYSLESHRGGGYNDYIQHTFRNKKADFSKISLKVSFLELSKECPMDSKTSSNQPR